MAPNQRSQIERKNISSFLILFIRIHFLCQCVFLKHKISILESAWSIFWSELNWVKYLSDKIFFGTWEIIENLYFEKTIKKSHQSFDIAVIYY